MNKEYLTYFTGKACLKGHYSERYTSNSVCLACKKLEYKPTGKKAGNSNLPERIAAIEAKEEFYFTGKVCKHGHVSKRYTSNSVCYECSLTVFKEKRRGKERQYSISKYGITPDQYDKMLIAQNGVCKICKQPEQSMNGAKTKLKLLAIDHCHDTTKVRALLCSRCNIGIGCFKHDPDLLKKAALYCEEHK